MKEVLGVVCSSFYVTLECFSRKMANFSVMDDEEYCDMFLTQSSSKMELVSLEEKEEENVFKSADYSDISDAEEDKTLEQRLR